MIAIIKTLLTSPRIPNGGWTFILLVQRYFGGRLSVALTSVRTLGWRFIKNYNSRDWGVYVRLNNYYFKITSLRQFSDGFASTTNGCMDSFTIVKVHILLGKDIRLEANQIYNIPLISVVFEDLSTITHISSIWDASIGISSYIYFTLVYKKAPQDQCSIGPPSNVVNRYLGASPDI